VAAVEACQQILRYARLRRAPLRMTGAALLNEKERDKGISCEPGPAFLPSSRTMQTATVPAFTEGPGGKRREALVRGVSSRHFEPCKAIEEKPCYLDGGGRGW
jgi:hypothetical protein